jgi:hypothetical protein
MTWVLARNAQIFFLFYIGHIATMCLNRHWLEHQWKCFSNIEKRLMKHTHIMKSIKYYFHEVCGAKQLNKQLLISTMLQEATSHTKSLFTFTSAITSKSHLWLCLPLYGYFKTIMSPILVSLYPSCSKESNGKNVIKFRIKLRANYVVRLGSST